MLRAMAVRTLDLAALRADFPALGRRRNGRPPIYLNNSCMTLRPRAVIDAVRGYYEDFPTCGGGRGDRSKPLHNWFQGELMLLIFNITFFFVYLSIPIASYLIVSGASRPFRNL